MQVVCAFTARGTDSKDKHNKTIRSVPIVVMRGLYHRMWAGRLYSRRVGLSSSPKSNIRPGPTTTCYGRWFMKISEDKQEADGRRGGARENRLTPNRAAVPATHSGPAR